MVKKFSESVYKEELKLWMLKLTWGSRWHLALFWYYFLMEQFQISLINLSYFFFKERKKKTLKINENKTTPTSAYV